VEIGEVVQTGAPGCHEGAASTIDSDVDRLLVMGLVLAGAISRSQRRLVTQRGRACGEDAGPRSLQPRQRTGVVDVHTRVDDRPLPAAYEPTDVVGQQPRVEGLGAGDHARLQGEVALDRAVHGGERHQAARICGTRVRRAAGGVDTVLVPTTSHWLAFLAASILFIQVPGPSLLFTIGRALTVGRRDALLSVAGNGVGITVQVMLIAVGLAAVVTASSVAYDAVKLVGASYVIWLGIQAIRRRADARSTLDAPVARPRRGGPLRSLRTGFVVGVTNPKTLVFFVAFLPQFVSAGSGHVGVQMAVLGVAFGVLAICSDSMWALLASKARDWFARKPTRLDKLAVTGGVMMVGLGATMLASE
jgi:threonine/homoserine/homoserine lactone efflux protein